MPASPTQGVAAFGADPQVPRRQGSGADRKDRARAAALPHGPHRALARERARSSSETTRRPTTRSTIPRARRTRRRKTTIVYVATRREPLTELTLETSSRNFSRSAVVQVARRARRPHRMGRDRAAARLSLVDFGSYHSESLGVSFPEQRQGRISHRDPQRGQSAAGDHGRQGAGQRLSGRLPGGRKGNLSPRATARTKPSQPNYDAAAVLAPLRLKASEPSEARLGRQSPTRPPHPSPATMRSLLNNPLLLGAARSSCWSPCSAGPSSAPRCGSINCRKLEGCRRSFSRGWPAPAVGPPQRRRKRGPSLLLPKLAAVRRGVFFARQVFFAGRPPASAAAPDRW